MELLESQSKREIYFKPNNSTENNFAKIILEIEEKIKDNNNLVRVVLDLSNCEKIDSSCIGSLLNIRNSLKSNFIDFYLTNLNDTVLEIINLSGLRKSFEIISEKELEEIREETNKKVKFKNIIDILKIKFETYYRKSYKKFIAYVTFLVFILSVLIVEFTFFRIENSRVSELSSFMNSYVWDIDDKNASDFAKVLIDTKNYKSIKITHPDDSLFIEKVREENNQSSLIKFLEILRIIRPVIIESNIIHKSEIIGKLEIVWMNDNIFIHLANGIFFILVYIIILSYIRIVNSKRELSFKNFEISEKMEEVQKLKKQQDGDYYLTSLLTKPLNNLFYTGEGLRVSYYISQKKKFEFKKKLQEIGGDICITDEIVLRGKKYLVFVNADAMGKSLQGAGGVLVFGAAFNSILMRNKNSIITARIYFPELWLKNTFVDIHKIFEAFGGSMLISCIIGLIEEDTNFMYWINAEHPGMILYRDGKANIIDNYNDIFMKLGTEGINNSLKINCFQLYKGDAIVIGSDGKDDLILGKNEFGMNIINDDPELFPKILEKEQGEIENIYEKLKEYGDYSDDFSLLKIEIAEPGFKEISNSEDLIDRYKKIKHLYLDGKIGECEKALLDTLSKYNDSSQILKFLVKIYYESKDFENVCKYIERYIELNPSDSELIFLAAYCFKKIGNFTMGIAFGERYRIRHPDVIRNFVNLAELYYLDKKFDRARKMVQKVLNYDSENEKALKILDLINTKVEKNEM